MVKWEMTHLQYWGGVWSIPTLGISLRKINKLIYVTGERIKTQITTMNKR